MCRHSEGSIVGKTGFDQYDVVKALDFERLGGTEGEARAIEVLTKFVTDAGLPYEIHPFQLFSFDTGSAKLSVAGAS